MAPLEHLDPASTGLAPRPFTGEEAQVLDTINRKIAAAESLGSMIDFLFASIQAILPCDRIGVSFVEDDGGRLVAHLARASYEPLLLKTGYAED